MNGYTKLVLVYGGPSAEHEVSCVSTFHVSRAADQDQFDVRIVGVTREGQWVDATDALADLPDATQLPSPNALGDASQFPAPLFEAFGDSSEAVVFPLIHGTIGEDGSLQGLLDVVGVPYVGAGVLASALCMEKDMAKAVLHHAGIPQGVFRTVDSPGLTPAQAERLGEELGFPCFVKPAAQGSSVGVAKVDSSDALLKAVGAALDYGERALVEAFVAGREIEVAVMGNEHPQSSAPGEIVPSQDFYDYRDKYVLGQAELLIPAPLTAPTTAAARELALTTYRTLQVEGLARVDLFLTGSGDLLVNEVNTLPGFTPISMYPKLWEYEGLSYSELITKLVEYAFDRHRRRSGYRRTAD